MTQMKNGSQPKGLLHIYHGSGKGKTTAALGLALRSKGAGMEVGVFQFLKSRACGELVSLRQLKIPVFRVEKEEELFFFQMTPTQKAAYTLEIQALFNKVLDALLEEQWELLILDELLDAIGLGLIPLEAVCQALAIRKDVEVVLTGRNPSERLLEMADYVTHMDAQKHPYEKGILGRSGIEF